MNTLGDVLKLVRAGHGNGAVRRALFGVAYFTIVGVGAVITAALYARAQFMAPRGFTGLDAVICASLAGGLLTIGNVIATSRRHTLAEARQIVSEKNICPRCFYPRVAESAMCSECGHPCSENRTPS